MIKLVNKVLACALDGVELSKSMHVSKSLTHVKSLFMGICASTQSQHLNMVYDEAIHGDAYLFTS